MKTPLKIPHRPGEAKYNDVSKQPLNPTRFWPFYAVIVAGIIVFGARLIYLQVIRGNDYTEAARENRISLVNLPAPRGVIYDRNGVQLVKNLPTYNVTLTPAYLPTDSIRLQELYAYVAQLTGVPVNTPPLEAGSAGGEAQPPRGITELVAEQESLAPYSPTIIKRNVPEDIALMLRGQLRRWPGLGISVTPQRDYPTGSLTSHIIGYMGPITREVEEEYRKLGFDTSRDKIGYAGLEAWEQDTLAGKNGYKYIEEDVAGLELRTVGDVVNPVPGNNLNLTIDVRLQASTQAALQRGINFLNLRTNTTKTQIGVAIAMNPITGEILSMASIPTYDNQRFARFIPVEYYEQLLKDPTNPLLNQAIGGQHAPGSVFKIVMAGAALAKGMDPNRKLFDPGKIVIENKYFPNDPGKARTVVCNKPTGHGDVDMITAIAQSCNVYFYKVGGGYAPDNVTGIDIEGIYEYANYFGFNRRTGIELPGERKGLIPNRDYKRLNIGENWSTGDTYIASIGQGYVLATPLQVLDSVTPYLNNGFSVKPTLIKEITDGEGNVVQPFRTQYRDTIPTTPEIDPVPISANMIEVVRRGMEGVLQPKGTGENLDTIEGVQIAGKSGTAEYCDNVAQKKDLCRFGAWPEHAWFLAYAPADKPEIAVVVFVYNGGEGSVTAGPIAQQILQAYFELKKTDASRTRPPAP